MAKQRKFIHSRGLRKQNDSEVFDSDYTFGDQKQFVSVEMPKYGVSKKNPNQVRKPKK